MRSTRAYVTALKPAPCLSRSGPALLLTCEHASPAPPPQLARLAHEHQRFLQSHRGYDAGALVLAEYLAQRTGAPLVVGKIGRLWIDLNRPSEAPDLVGVLARRLSPKQQQLLIAQFHARHWHTVRAKLQALVANHKTVMHLACHSFTPILRGKIRQVDVGVLFDPRRADEAQFAAKFCRELRKRAPELRVRLNAPYRGTAPGLTTSMRKEWPSQRYLGVELEVNQRFIRRGGRAWAKLYAAVGDTLATLLAPPSTASTR